MDGLGEKSLNIFDKNRRLSHLRTISKVFVKIYFIFKPLTFILYMQVLLTINTVNFIFLPDVAEIFML